MSDASRGPHAKEIKTAEGIGRDDPAIAIRGVMVRYDQEVGRLMLTIMGGIAEFERNLIRKRCEEGIERAKRKGVTFGLRCD